MEHKYLNRSQLISLLDREVEYIAKIAANFLELTKNSSQINTSKSNAGSILRNFSIRQEALRKSDNEVIGLFAFLKGLKNIDEGEVIYQYRLSESNYNVFIFMTQRGKNIGVVILRINESEEAKKEKFEGLFT